MADNQNTSTQFRQLVDDWREMYGIATDIVELEEYTDVTIEDGTTRPTWYKKFVDRFRELILESGYDDLGAYGPGIVFTDTFGIVSDSEGNFWSPGDDFEFPYETTGAGLEEEGFIPTDDDSFKYIFDKLNREFQVAVDASAEAKQARDESVDARNQAVSAAQASGDVNFFDTYADAEAASLSEGDIVEILDTGDRYRYESGALVFKTNLRDRQYQTGTQTASTISDPENLSFTTPNATVPRTIQDRFSELITPLDFGAVGDATVNDDAAFTTLQSYFSGYVINLAGKTYLVNSLPIGNTYINGFWKLDTGFSVPEEVGSIFSADDSHGVISDVSDTGASGPAYSGGVNDTPTFPGRTNRNRRILIGSQNCRSDFNLSGCYSSIYSAARGNVSGNFASRQSLADCPQAVNIAAEEGIVRGFGGINANTQFSITNGTKCGNLSTRLCFAESSRYAQNISSVSSKAGGGWGALLTPVFSGGSVVSVTIDDGGEGYDTDHVMSITARQVSPTTDATFTFSVNSSGTITSVTVTNGGSGYDENAIYDIRVQYPSNTYGEAASNLSTIVARTHGRAGATVASTGTINRGDASLVASSESTCTTAKGVSRQTILASSGCDTSATGATVIAGTLSQSNHIGAVVIGRRVASASERTLVIGDGGSGNANTANRKFEVSQGGTVRAAGTVTGSVAFTDYAELFENQVEGEIPLGTLVELVGRKVRPATGAAVLGVVSGTAFIVSGDTPFEWAGRYMLGEFGEPVYEDVDCVDFHGYSGVVSEAPTPIPADARYYTESVRKENPDYDPSIINVPRSERKSEWSTVGLMGQVYVRVDKTVSPDGYVSAVSGIGTASESRTGVRCMEIYRDYDPGKGYAVAFCALNTGA